MTLEPLFLSAPSWCDPLGARAVSWRTHLERSGSSDGSATLLEFDFPRAAQDLERFDYVGFLRG